MAASVRVALVAPVSGTLGLIGPGAINCAALAAGEIDEAGGLLGRPVELTLVDGGRPAAEVAAEVAALVRRDRVQAVVGVHSSDVRMALVAAIGAAVPYVYTPPYEGGERAPGVYLAGETPDRQVRPVLRWLAERNRGRRWFLLGNDYVWPRRVGAAARDYLRAVGADVVAERYVRRRALDPEPLLAAVAAARADAVLLTLIGRDLVDFNRAFAASPLAQRVLRLCPALEENGLLGVGGDDTGELYATMGYFASVATDAGLDFVGRYAARFGPLAPVPGGHGEGCYEGLWLLAALVARAGSLATPALDAVCEGTVIDGGGRGRAVMHGRHLHAPVFLARAADLDLDVVAGF
ncbi:MAG TPA: substrate-binding domain-containing protein [Mycobacteriales bacterium]|nr:substrate-binding domain-containing protein [Mycobacteriales bacterium]